MPDTPHSYPMPSQIEIEALLDEIESMRRRTFRKTDLMLDEVGQLIRRTDRMLAAVRNTPHEPAVHSARTLLHCMQCGLVAA